MRNFLLALLMFIIPAFIFAQDNKPQDVKPADRHEFKMVSEVKTSPVKSQGGTGTCWSYATTSFIETEMLRMGKGEFDLSEMFFARNAYVTKADRFVRFQGKSNFGQGGQAHDVIDVLRAKGMVTDEAFSGLINGAKSHNHGKMEQALNKMVTAVSKSKKPDANWMDAVVSTLDSSLGKIPEKFTVNGKEYTPKSFAKESGFNPDNYVEITSFSHHPFYQKFELEVPDNWSHAQYYNAPLDDIMKIMEYSLKKGYSVVWDGDVSEKGWKGKDGYAVVPEDTDADVTKPEKEKVITDKLHLEAFNDFSTTDDHLMHITGMAKDQNGTKFWLTKNSWGDKSKYKGYWYMSDAFARYKMVAILVHKNSIPKDIKVKLGIK